MDVSPEPLHHRRRRRSLLVTLACSTAAVGVFVAVWFEPQKLWIDERVSERERAVTADPRSGPVELWHGTFVSREHRTAGAVRILRGSDGSQVARLEGLDTSNGPDLYVYLSARAARAPADQFDDDFVSLGRLKGNLGDQNYDVPAGTDVARYRTLVIWCDRFDAVFGAADLAPM